jgi:hypothetical protein
MAYVNASDGESCEACVAAGSGHSRTVVGVEWLPRSGGRAASDDCTHLPPAEELALLVVDPSVATLRLTRALSETPYGGTSWTELLRVGLDALTRFKELQVRLGDGPFDQLLGGLHEHGKHAFGDDGNAHGKLRRVVGRVQLLFVDVQCGVLPPAQRMKVIAAMQRVYS